MKTMSVVLMPDDTISKKLCLLSADLHQDNKIKLGAGALPHMTVVQFDERSVDVDRIREWLTTQQRSIDIVFSGLNFVPSRRDDHTWVEVSVLKSDNLRSLQARFSDFFKAADIKVTSGVGDDFRPHVTVGLLPTTKIAEVKPPLENYADLLRTKTKTMIALAVNGKHFKVETTL